MKKPPHKPVLLLSVMDAIETGEISDNKVFITPELIARFNMMCGILGGIGGMFLEFKPSGAW